MTSRERIYKAINGKEVDRVPFVLWRHFPNADQTSQGLAKAIIEFQKKFEFDLIKVTPASGYFAEAFGAKFIQKKDKEGQQKGTRKCVFSPIKNPQDWQKLRTLNVNEGILGRELKTLRLIKKEIGKDVPIVQTVPNPLTLVKVLREKFWLNDLRKYPKNLEIGLSVITETITKFSLASLQNGADGIFFFTQVASYDILSEKEYKIFGMKYDYQILEKLRQKTDLLILHIHGQNIMFNLLKDYPVQIINWHDRKTWPTLSEAQKLFGGAVLGGIDEWNVLLRKKPIDVKKQVKDAIKQTNGRRLIIGPGCVIPINTPEANIRAIREVL